MAKVALSILLFLMLTLWAVWWCHPPWFAIEEVIMEGELYEEAHLVQEQLDSLVGKDLLRLKEHAVSEILSSYAWIDHWRIQKRFLHQLHIKITPKQPVAKWNKYWVANDATVFLQGNFPGSWMTLQGEKKDLPILLKYCLAWQQDLSVLSIESCRYDRGQWRLLLPTGLTIHLGSGRFDQRIAKLLAITTKVDVWKAWHVLDLRYPHGFAYR